jgi:hypothetical protein
MTPLRSIDWQQAPGEARARREMSAKLPPSQQRKLPALRVYIRRSPRSRRWHSRRWSGACAMRLLGSWPRRRRRSRARRPGQDRCAAWRRRPRSLSAAAAARAARACASRSWWRPAAAWRPARTTRASQASAKARARQASRAGWRAFSAASVRPCAARQRAAAMPRGIAYKATSGPRAASSAPVTRRLAAWGGATAR